MSVARGRWMPRRLTGWRLSAEAAIVSVSPQSRDSWSAGRHQRSRSSPSATSFPPADSGRGFVLGRIGRISEPPLECAGDGVRAGLVLAGSWRVTTEMGVGGSRVHASRYSANESSVTRIKRPMRMWGRRRATSYAHVRLHRRRCAISLGVRRTTARGTAETLLRARARSRHGPARRRDAPLRPGGSCRQQVLSVNRKEVLRIKLVHAHLTDVFRHPLALPALRDRPPSSTFHGELEQLI